MLQNYKSHNFVDENGNPEGGQAHAVGVSISWQRGPLKEGEENGAFVETVIAMCVDRLQFFQKSKFACIQNGRAIEHLQEALKALNERTKDRESRGVEGTHNV